MPHRFRPRLALVAIIATGVAAAFSLRHESPAPASSASPHESKARVTDTTPPTQPSHEDPATIPADWKNQIQQRLTATSYAAEAEDRQLIARNGAQGLEVRWSDKDVEIAPLDKTKNKHARPVRFSTTAIGRGTRLEAVEPPRFTLGECQSDGAVDITGKCLPRIEAKRGAVTEWWENGPQGIEQGYTIAEPPSGSESIVVNVAVHGASVDVAPDGLSARLHPPERHAMQAGSLSYGGLKAWDSRGTLLAARMEAQSESIRLVVDDTDAVYPITIDPMVTTAVWTKTPTFTNPFGQSAYQLGYRVSPAGDVNGDGYADVLAVAEDTVEDGDLNRGAVYLFLGSSSGLGASAVWAKKGDRDGAQFGFSVAAAGDVNGDGRGDVIIGAPTRQSFFTAGAGAAFLYLGNATGLEASPVATKYGTLLDENVGHSVASAGDFNGDGYSDVVVGSPGYFISNWSCTIDPLGCGV